MRDERCIWMIGDGWRDLREALDSHRQATVMTEHGTVHLLDLDRGVTLRAPGLAGNLLTGDFQSRQLLDVTVLTPCGLVTRCETIERSQWSTPLLLVAAGIDDLDPAVANTLADRLRSDDHETPDITGHPAEACGALHCPQPRPTINPTRDD